MARFGLKAVAAAVLVGLSGLTASAQLVTFNPGNAGSDAPTSTAANIGAGNLTAAGATLTPTGTSLQGSNFNTIDPGLGTIAGGKGYSFMITPAADGVIDFSSKSLTFSGPRDADGPKKFDLITNITGADFRVGTVTTDIVGGITNYNISLNGLGNAVPVTANTAYTFLLDGFGAASGAGTFDLTGNLVLNGTFSLTPVPEPATVGLLAALGLGVVRLRWRLSGAPARQTA